MTHRSLMRLSNPALVLPPAQDAPFTQDWWRPERRAESIADTSFAFYALIAFTAILLLSPQAWFPILKSVRIALVMAMVAIAAHVLDRTAMRRRVTRVRTEMVLAFLLAAWSIVTVPFSLWPGGSILELTDRYLKALTFFWLIATLVTTLDQARVFSWTLALCSLPLAAVGLYHFRAGHFLYSSVPGVQRIAGYTDGSGLTGNPNDLALMLNLIIPIAGALALNAKGRLRLVAAIAVLLSAAAVIATFSRAGFITLAVTFVFILVALARRRAPVAAAAVLVLALAVPFALPQSYIDRLGTITNIAADRTGSAQGRWADWKAASELVTEHPISGVGVGQNILALNEVRGHTWRAVHNVYLEYAVDLGLPGAILFLWLFGACLYGASRVAAFAGRAAASRPAMGELATLAGGVQISLIAFGVAALFYPVAYQFYFFCFAGLAVALKSVYRVACQSAS